jgi:Spy/CpxP family protein refolding chaperone
VALALGVLGGGTTAEARAGLPEPGALAAASQRGTPTQGGRGVGPRREFEWWNDASVQRDLGLTADRIKKLNGIYQTGLRRMEPVYRHWTKLNAELEQMTAERVANVSSYELKVGDAERLRSRLFENRMVMFYDMYLKLEPVQYQKLRAILDARMARGGGPRREFEWWNDATVQRELGLTVAKARKLNDIYQSRLQRMRPFSERWVKLNGELQTMTAARVADITTYELKVGDVESLRSRLFESRAVMLYEMSLELDPEQYKKLLNIRERRFESREGRGGSVNGRR